MGNEYGPNQDGVDELLERLESVNQVQALFLASLAGEDPDRQRARQAVLEAAHLAHREKQLDAAQGAVRRWVNRWFSGGPELSGYTRDISPAQAAVDASPVVLDAIGAQVMADRIAPEDFEALMDPWLQLWRQPEPETATSA